jgi:signal peptidase I
MNSSVTRESGRRTSSATSRRRVSGRPSTTGGAAARDIALVAAVVGGLLVVLVALFMSPMMGTHRVVALGTSMLPTIESWEVVRVDPDAYTLEGPERADVVVLQHTPDQQLRNAKRIVGLPGETVAISGGHVYIDGEPLDEPYLPAGTITASSRTEYSVPDGHYFVLGDNRAVSADSRHFGFIPLEWISGRALV